MGESDNENHESSDQLAQDALKSGRLPEKARGRYLVAVLIVMASVAFGNIALKYGFKHLQFGHLNSVVDIFQYIGKALSNVWLVAGICLLIIHFAALTSALRYGPLSLTVPIRGAAAYAGTAVLAVFFLGEQVNMMHWVSIALIVVGVSLIGISGGKE